jgi:hypothetical protein
MFASIRSYNGVGDIVAIRSGVRKGCIGYSGGTRASSRIASLTLQVGCSHRSASSTPASRWKRLTAQCASCFRRSSRNSCQIRPRLWPAKW